VSAIKTPYGHKRQTRTTAGAVSGATSRIATLALLVIAALAVTPVSSAFAGAASTGKLLFYPCTTCHPVVMIPGPGGTERPSRSLPNTFTGHPVELEAHDNLGAGDKACMVCHDEPTKNPGKLKLIDGSLIDITGDVSKVCYRCHSAKYKEWKVGIHGRHMPKCTAAGCHDPHTPQWIYAEPLLPFIGTGFQFKAVGEREPFMALAKPGVDPSVTTPRWLGIVAAIGFVGVAGAATSLIRGRSKR
jgi:hypothetical protein